LIHQHCNITFYFSPPHHAFQIAAQSQTACWESHTAEQMMGWCQIHMSVAGADGNLTVFGEERVSGKTLIGQWAKAFLHKALHWSTPM